MENIAKTHLVFSADKKSCKIVFSGGKESDFFESMDELFIALKDLKKKGKITALEASELWGETLNGNLEFYNKIVTTVAVMIPRSGESKKEKLPGFSDAFSGDLLNLYKNTIKGKALPGFYPCPFCVVKDHYHLFFEDYMSPAIRSKSEARKFLQIDFEAERITVEQKVLVDLQIDQAQIPEFIGQN